VRKYPDEQGDLPAVGFIHARPSPAAR
jgi:hypothetical protein